MQTNLRAAILKFPEFLFNLLAINDCSPNIDDIIDSLSIKNDFDTHHTCLSPHCLEKDFFICNLVTKCNFSNINALTLRDDSGFCYGWNL